MKRLFLKTLFLAVAISTFLSCSKSSGPEEPKEIAVTSVNITQASAELKVGETVQLTATVQPSNATQKTISWTSSNLSVATIANGLVTAVGEGKSTITASAGGKNATCTVTVTKKIVLVTEVSLDKTSIELIEGNDYTLTATVKPDDATDKTVTWTSSAESIATVQNGKVTAIKEGQATITAKAGEKSATCKVTVSKKIIPVTSITLDKTSVEMVEGDELTLTATVKPDDATDKTVTWTSSAESIATIQDGKITAIKEGQATITAKAGEKSATCKVTVSQKVIPVTSITLDKTSAEMVEGDELTLTANVKPDDATDKTVTWTSSAESIATVQDGKVTAIKEGQATIIAKAGEKSATCIITIKKKNNPSIIAFNDSNVKAICISKWDTDNDGELSYLEAASIYSIGTAFAYNNVIVSFNELQHFTGLSELEKDAFRGCRKLKSISIPKTIKTIGYSVFFYCENLTDVILPETITSIGIEAFKYCTRLRSLDIPSKITIISNSVFSDCTSLESVAIPYGVSTIGEKAFHNCKKLSSIEIPNSVTVIEKEAFSYSGLTKIVLPNSVREIKQGAFLYCTLLTDITLPNSIKTIEDGVFQSCSKITNITIPETVTTIGIGSFGGCRSLSNLVLPNNLTTIGEQAFQYCINLEIMVIPNSVTSIGFGQFIGCENLKTVHLPSYLIKIGNQMFKDCTSLSSITLPDNLQIIGTQAFINCRNLTKVSLPKNVNMIGDYAFNDCIRLSEVIVLRTMPPSLGTGGFNNTNNCPIKVPSESVEKYKTSTIWSDYASRIQAIQ